MTIHFIGGQVITDAMIDSIDFVKGLVYFRPNSGRGALSIAPYNMSMLVGTDHDPRLEKMDVARLAEEV
jgi:hypothetical protein